MDEMTRKMLGYKTGEKTAGEGKGLPTPKLDLVGLVLASNQFLRDYHNEHGMLPSQNPDIKLQ